MATDWYKNAIIYQIYPRSFKDANGDGVGDLAGITSKLDYLQDLGVDAIWLSPIYRSPMADFGYDVSDYRDIDPTFGTLEDFDQLLAAAHQHDIKVVMDLIPNHTSDQHPWFIESRSSLNNPKRDWYIWKDPKSDGSFPNNWQSTFGGPAWTLDENTDQYYMHSFLKEQPDLNWENPEVHRAVQDIMRFWYDRGVDGFRVDAILFMSKDLEFRDNPEPHEQLKETLQQEFEAAFSHGVGEHLPAYLKVLTDVTKEYDAHCLFLEAVPDEGGAAGYAQLYGYIDTNVAVPFYFGLLGGKENWHAQSFKSLVDEFETLLPADAFPAYVLGNHDTSRLATRIGSQNVRAAAVAQLTLPGTKFIYYGEELGMSNVNIPPEKRVDASNVPRDGERTPMRWSADVHAGFSKVDPWLPIGPGTETQNVEVLLADERSILNLYRKLIKLQRELPALNAGRFEPLNLASGEIYGFKRITSEQQLMILINFSDNRSKVALEAGSGELLLTCTLEDAGKHGEFEQIALEANEAVIIKLDS